MKKLNSKKKIILFGAGGGGRRLYEKLKYIYRIVCFIDNDKKKDASTYNEIPIYYDTKEKLMELEFDQIIISSVVGMEDIVSQLKGYGISENVIITKYVEIPIIARNIFCEKLGELFQRRNMCGSCAEAGVFQGAFAKIINENFPEKKLYLFDTFEGFDERDVLVEKNEKFSSAKKSDYDATSVELVINKMKFPDNCIIKKGFFPETAIDIDDVFCFVNLDLDLYQPTLEGLKLFRNKMVKGGVILVHDYFTTDFKGVKEAVDQFIMENTTINLAPIGDGMSIMLTGF